MKMKHAVMTLLAGMMLAIGGCGKAQTDYSGPMTSLETADETALTQSAVRILRELSANDQAVFVAMIRVNVMVPEKLKQLDGLTGPEIVEKSKAMPASSGFREILGVCKLVQSVGKEQWEQSLRDCISDGYKLTREVEEMQAAQGGQP